MIKNIVVFIFCSVMICSCTENKKQHPATALDAGREFIRASLDGDFKTAEMLLSTDPQNQQAFDSYKAYYQKWPKDRKEHFKKANYEIKNYEDVNDSTTIINYSNDYMNKPMDIKVIRENKEWKIDFKYTYSGNLPTE